MNEFPEALHKSEKSVIPAKAGIQKKEIWIPHQVRNDNL